MALLTINGINMPEFQSLSVSSSDVDSDSSKRNELGVVQRDRIRAGARKISVKWPCLTQADAAIILSALEPAKLTVTYPDPASSDQMTKTMYAGDKSFDAFNTATGMCWGLSVDLTEY